VRLDESTVITLWFVIVGVLLLFMAVSQTLLRRLPISSPLLYLLVGMIFGEAGLELLHLDPFDDAKLLERLTEIAVIVSLFTTGLKLRLPLRHRLWRLPLVLASISMVLTIGLIALGSYAWLGMSAGAAILLGAVLAPTDPVLASDIQVTKPGDQDRLRFALTGEAGLNDGMAFPFVMLGLGLLGYHGLGDGWSRWWLVDVAWAIPGGLFIGAGLGAAIGWLALRLRRTYPGSQVGEDFLTMGLIAVTYGIALLAHTYAFLAVFAAGLAMRKLEEQAIGHNRMPDEVLDPLAPEELDEKVATDRQVAPAVMARSVLQFNEQLERIGEVGVMVLVGAMISTRYVPMEAIWFVPLLFLVVRPVAVAVGLIGSDTTRVQRGLISWFGVRGIGSIYYLMYAVVHGVNESIAEQMIGLTLTVVVVSVVLHGVTVTPMMAWYNRQRVDIVD
jgi:NhaP-type Na+/H+ or K+/H+ antiporter